MRPFCAVVNNRERIIKWNCELDFTDKTDIVLSTSSDLEKQESRQEPCAHVRVLERTWGLIEIKDRPQTDWAGHAHDGELQEPVHKQEDHLHQVQRDSALHQHWEKECHRFKGGEFLFNLSKAKASWNKHWHGQQIFFSQIDLQKY